MREWFEKLKDSSANYYGRKFIRTTYAGLLIVLLMLLTAVFGAARIDPALLIILEVLYTILFIVVLIRMLNIGQQEREIQAVKKRLMAASYDTGSSGSEVWLEIKEGLSRAAKAVIRMVRQFLDRL